MTTPEDSFKRTTEQESEYDLLEQMDALEIARSINDQDKKVALAVEKCLPQIAALIDATANKMMAGGRLFYIGAGTSGRLGILDASECPPTFGVESSKVIGLIAGGDAAIRNAVENAEDDERQAIKDLNKFNLSAADVVVGIAASGTTPYVVAWIESLQRDGHSYRWDYLQCQ